MSHDNARDDLAAKAQSNIAANLAAKIDPMTHVENQPLSGEVVRLAREAVVHDPEVNISLMGVRTIIETALLALRSEGEAVAWVPQAHLDFLDRGREADIASSAIVHDRPNEEMGWTVPLFRRPPSPKGVRVTDEMKGPYGWLVVPDGLAEDDWYIADDPEFAGCQSFALYLLPEDELIAQSLLTAALEANQS